MYYTDKNAANEVQNYCENILRTISDGDIISAYFRSLLILFETKYSDAINGHAHEKILCFGKGTLTLKNSFA